MLNCLWTVQPVVSFVGGLVHELGLPCPLSLVLMEVRAVAATIFGFGFLWVYAWFRVAPEPYIGWLLISVGST